MSSYPEWTVGYIDFTPGDDDGVFDGFCRDVDAKECVITIVCNLDVNRVAFRVLEKKSAQSQIKRQYGKIKKKDFWCLIVSSYKMKGHIWKMTNKITLRDSEYNLKGFWRFCTYLYRI